MADQKLLFKRGTKEALETKLVGANIPLEGEPIYETDTGKLKIGDGVANYASLPYLSGGSAVEQIYFGNKYEFPSTGVVNKVYIAKDESRSYIWNTSSTTYTQLSLTNSDIEDYLKQLDGGNASTTWTLK